MERKWHSRKLNDAGMSLVEVVISMAILSVVILGVLHSFVYSANYNARSRMRQQTTAAAQTVMENFKAYSVQEIYDKFAAYDPEVSGSGFVLNDGVGTAYTGQPGQDMTFTISGMQYQNETYDVEVRLSGHASQAADVDILSYSTPTQEHSAVFVGYAGMDADALTAIMGLVAQEWTDKENAALAGDATSDPDATPVPTTVSHSSNEVDSSKIEITKREIKVNVSEVSGNNVATVSCVYSFEVNGYSYNKDIYGNTDTFDLSGEYELDLSGSTEDGHSLSQEIFNQHTELETLTLYYYPAYRYVPGSGDPSAPVKVGEDHIYINNSASERIQCYIYKQKNMAVSDSRLSTSESVYEINLHLNNAYVYDDNLNTLFGNDMGSIVDSKIHVEGSDPQDKRYHGIGYAAVNTSYPTNSDYSPAIPASESISTGESISESVRMMYDIEIDICESGSATVLNTLKGTIIE